MLAWCSSVIRKKEEDNMNVITNQALIRRNARIAQFSGLAGLAVLLGGMYFLFVQPEQFAIIWVMVLLGFILSQVGIYFTNRWGRRPRPDERLNQALKGLDHNYTLYHYTSPTGHLLVGPAGVWVLLPRYQRGTITYDKGRWRQKGGGIGLAYMKFFGQEGLGRPDLEINAEVDSVEKFLKQHMSEEELPPVQAVLIFTNEKVNLQDVDDAPTPTMLPKKLKEFIRKQVKARPVSMDKIRKTKDALEGPAMKAAGEATQE
jgi:hypothetical protein